MGGDRRPARALRRARLHHRRAVHRPERHVPLLVLHGFPTSSFDYAAVLDRLRAGRRVVLFDMVGYGLSAKPDRAYSIALQADVAAAYVAALGIDRLALLTHDMGDTVGGELLARRCRGHVAGGGDVPRRDQREHLHRASPADQRPAAAARSTRRSPAAGDPDRRRVHHAELARDVQLVHAARARGLARGPRAAGSGAGRPRRRPPRAPAGSSAT